MADSRDSECSLFSGSDLVPLSGAEQSVEVHNRLLPQSLDYLVFFLHNNL